MSDFKIKIEEPKLLSEDIAESIKAAIIKALTKKDGRLAEAVVIEHSLLSGEELAEQLEDTDD
jgi:hypothetical protein